MKRYKDFLCISDLKRLFESIGIENGSLEGKPISDQCFEKVVYEGEGNPPPGSRVKILWKDPDALPPPLECDPTIDDGYIFTLPGQDWDDVYMAGIVHIPYPTGGSKDQPEPEWHTITELCANELVEKITITKGEQNETTKPTE